MRSLIKHNERGMALPLLIVLIVIVLGVIGGIYWFVIRDKDSNTGANQSAEDKAAASAMLAACEKEVGDDDFCKYASNMGSLYSYQESFTAVTTGSFGGMETTSTMKSDGKGNMHTISTTSQGVAESISLNNVTYTKASGQNFWYRIPSDTTTSSDDEEEDAPSYDFDSSESTGPKTIYKNLGKEACGNLTCIKYQTYSEDTPNNTWTVWFDDKEFKTRKMEMIGEGYTSTTVYTYEPVTITEPSPVQDMPDYSSMSAEELQRQLQQYGGN